MADECTHSVQLHGLCALCGTDISAAKSNIKTVPITHDASGLVVSIEEAERLDQETSSRLLREKKLSLILDLDQTVLHATIENSISHWMSDSNNPNSKDIYAFNLPDSQTKYFIKLRPGTFQFLHELTQIYEMHIYTMGSRHYAEAVAKVLDPKKTLFQDRILSRDDSGSFHVKSLERLFPCDQSMAVVIDDRGDVWRWSESLIKVRPYNFFIGTGDINAPPSLPTNGTNAPSASNSAENTEEAKEKKGTADYSEDSKLLTNAVQLNSENVETKDMSNDQKNSESTEASNFIPQYNKYYMQKDEDKELFTILEKLKDLHMKFYREQGADISRPKASVQKILSGLRSKVLENVVITFSGVIPLGQNPRQHDLWNWCVSFGAICVEEFNEYVTHVVAAKRGTLKVNSAKAIPGVYIVNPGWALNSISLWTRLKEDDYLLEEYVPQPTVSHADLKLLQDDEDLSIRFGTDAWKDVDREMEEFMGSEWSDSNPEEDEEEEEGKLLVEKSATAKQTSVEEDLIEISFLEALDEELEALNSDVEDKNLSLDCRNKSDMLKRKKNIIVDDEDSSFTEKKSKK